MTLQEIKNNYKKKSWLRLCTLHSINKWDLIDGTEEPIFPGKYYIRKTPTVDTRYCLQCKTMFELGIYKNTFIVRKKCNCGKDGTNLATISKLMCYFDKSTSEKILTKVFLSRKKGLPNTVDYWIYKGHTIEQAKDHVKRVQKSRSMRSPSAQPGAVGYTNRSLEFWIKKGFSLDDAKLKLKETQTTNGLRYYVKKYGEIEGLSKYNSRIEKWLSSPRNLKMTLGRSKKSLELFKKIGFGFYGEEEKTVRGKLKVHRVDYIYNNKIIEFFGDYWHGNPEIYSKGQLIRKKRIEDVWAHDNNKIEDLRNNGYSVLIIWEKEYCKSPDTVLKLCKDFIDENNIINC